MLSQAVAGEFQSPERVCEFGLDAIVGRLEQMTSRTR
jgi:hypothetical protein